jgi:hypothetical protein
MFAWIMNVGGEKLQCVMKVFMKTKKTGVDKIKQLILFYIPKGTNDESMVLNYEAYNADIESPLFETHDESAFLKRIGKDGWAKMIERLNSGEDFDAAIELQKEFIEEANILLKKAKTEPLKKLPEDLGFAWWTIM